VLYVITKSVWGGALKYVYDLATNLPTDRFDVAVAAGGDPPERPSSRAGGLLFQKLQLAGVYTIHIPELDRDIHIGKELRSFCALLDLFRREQPDIIHLNSSKAGGLGGIAGRIASWRTGKKTRIIFTVHGWGFLEDRPALWRAAVLIVSWISTLFQDKVILINSRDYAAARKFIPRRKLALIHNGIAQHIFLPREQARRFFAEKIRREIPLDALLIGTIAELTKNKGLNYLIDSVNQIKFQISNFKFQIMIIGAGEERVYLEKQIRDLGLENIVSLLGFVPDASRYLAGMDIFVLPSVKEGLPYVVMEAMAAGTPVIASNVGGIPDLISHNETGMLVPPKNPEALAKTIESLAKDPQFRMTLGKHARDAVRTKFSLCAMLKKTQQLYEAAD